MQRWACARSTLLSSAGRGHAPGARIEQLQPGGAPDAAISFASAAAGVAARIVMAMASRSATRGAGLGKIATGSKQAFAAG